MIVLEIPKFLGLKMIIGHDMFRLYWQAATDRFSNYSYELRYDVK